MSLTKHVLASISTIVALLGIAVLLGRLVADDAIYWLDSETETCSEDNDDSDCSDGVAATDPGGITCASGDHYLNASLDVFEEGGANTQATEKFPVDCYKPVTCTKESHTNTKRNVVYGASTCYGTDVTTCYNCSYTLGDPVPEESDLLGDCAEE